jgi:hypothetical protein
VRAPARPSPWRRRGVEGLGPPAAKQNRVQKGNRAQDDSVNPPEQEIPALAMRDKAGRNTQQHGKDQKIRCHDALDTPNTALRRASECPSYNTDAGDVREFRGNVVTVPGKCVIPAIISRHAALWRSLSRRSTVLTSSDTVVRCRIRFTFISSYGVARCMVQRLSQTIRSPSVHACR